MTEKVVEPQDKIDELIQFSNELQEYCVYVAQIVNKESMTGATRSRAAQLLRTIGYKSGFLGKLITELTDEKDILINDKPQNMWNIALRLPIDKISWQGAGFCVTVVNRAIGKLQDDIKAGKRDKQTGELKNKSRISGLRSIESTTTTTNWKLIEDQFGISKIGFRRKINFISDNFRRDIIFRDVEQAFSLASSGFSKPAVILAGSVIEELLRLYLQYKGIQPIKQDFEGYIQTCTQNRLLKDSVSRLSHSVRQFRNLVHLSAEETKKHTISKATAIGAVSSIFTIANDFSS